MKNPIKRLAERCVNYTKNPVLEVEGELRLGKGVKLGQDCHITARNLYIGDFAAIEAGVVIEATDLYHRGLYPDQAGMFHIRQRLVLPGVELLDRQLLRHRLHRYPLPREQRRAAEYRASSPAMWPSGTPSRDARYHSAMPLEVMDDAWFVGHCIVAPVKAGEMSVALPGSVITRDMEANRVYAGIPATDMTDKLGPPFKETTPEERAEKMRAYLEEFYATNPEHRGKVELGDPGRGNGYPLRPREHASIPRPFSPRGGVHALSAPLASQVPAAPRKGLGSP